MEWFAEPWKHNLKFLRKAERDAIYFIQQVYIPPILYEICRYEFRYDTHARTHMNMRSQQTQS
jgi:hypothetical protein